MRQRGSSWASRALVVGLVPLTVFGAIRLGLRLSPAGRVEPTAASASLDYSRSALGRFAPLRGAFIEGVLGEVIRGRPSAGDAAGSGPGRTGEPDDDSGIEVDHPPTNDDVRSAYPVSSVPFRATTESSTAKREEGEPRGCAPAAGGTLWYRYRPPANIGLAADTFGTDHAVALSVYTRSAGGAMETVDCHSDVRGNALVAFAAAAGTTYYFQLDAPATRGGLVFNLVTQGITRITSNKADGTPATAPAGTSILSADGRFLAFGSWSRGIVADDRRLSVPDPSSLECGPSGNRSVPTGEHTMCVAQTYVRDRVTHRNRLVSVSASGDEFGDDASGPWGISSDGRFVSFVSTATNLVYDDTNVCRQWVIQGQCFDVFVRDVVAGTTTRVSVPSGGGQADGASYGGPISGDGRFVAFTSEATNLVDTDGNGVADDANGSIPDVFVHDRATRTTTLVSVSSSERQANIGLGAYADPGSFLISMSQNGRYVMFRSSASNLDEERDDTNGFFDVFVRDLVAGTTTRVSVSSDEQQADDNSLYALSIYWAVSDDGRYATFNSSASNLVSGDTNDEEDLFVRDLKKETTDLVTISWDGQPSQIPGNPTSRVRDPHAELGRYWALTFGISPTSYTETMWAMTPDGRYVVFSSAADNLVRGDGNGFRDIFLRDLRRGRTIRVSVSSSGREAHDAIVDPTLGPVPLPGSSDWPSISADGRFITFTSIASDLVEGDTNNVPDAFVQERPGFRRPSGWY